MLNGACIFRPTLQSGSDGGDAKYYYCCTTEGPFMRSQDSEFHCSGSVASPCSLGCNFQKSP